MTNIVVTGGRGFIGSNLILALRRNPNNNVTVCEIDTPTMEIDRALGVSEAIYHLAGVNRPPDEEDYEIGNVGSLKRILDMLSLRKRSPLIVLASSAQALNDSPYGRSKRRAEALLMDYCERTKAPARIFRLPGVFGKWCRPNYNSVVATFCHNIARDMPIQITDRDKEIELVYVDDVVDTFISLGATQQKGTAFFEVNPVFKVRLGDLASALQEIRASRQTLRAADLSDPFLRRLYGTYISYLPASGFSYGLDSKIDARGELAEVIRANGHGQFFVSRTKPGFTRGNHYHNRKVEKFFVLEGEALISFRHMVTGEKNEYLITAQDHKAIDIPPGWTHSILNTGRSDLIVLFWASETFDPDQADTYMAEV
jgi:UDP-2-acetamido-2,6-beta-L-arabino-hexul-4-ose reductase